MSEDLNDIFSKVEFSEFYNILKDLLDPTENLETKTEVRSPYSLSILQTYSFLLNQFIFKKSSTLLQVFIKNYLTNMISHNRLSRKEIVEILKNYTEDSEAEENNRPLRLK